MVAAALSDVRRRIAVACERVGRAPEDVTLVAVSKAHSDNAVLAAYEAGQRDFGENRADALRDRIAAGRLPADIRWHFVGSVQRRKVAEIVGATFLLHSMDRERLARRWVGSGGGPALLQVNISREPQKHGVEPEEAAPLALQIAEIGVDLRGLMTITALAAEPEESRREFIELAELRDVIRPDLPQVEELSMGMTDDFETAIECGATMVRVGRAIFGERPGAR